MINEGLLKMMQQPAFQMGTGLLGRTDMPFGQALGGTANDMMQYQMAQQEAQYAAQEAERKRREQEEALRQQVAMQQWAAQQGMDPRMPKEAMLAAYKNTLPKTTDDMAEYQRALSQGFKGSFMDYMMALRQAGATSVKVENQMPKFPSSVTSGAQQAMLAAQGAMPEIARGREMLEFAPELANPFARAFSKIGGLVAGAGKFSGSKSLEQAGEFIRPEATTPSGEVITPSKIKGQLLAVKTSAREIMAPDKGPLTQQEQADYKEALGMLESNDYRENLVGLELLEGVMGRRMKRLGMTLEAAGERIPGKLYPGFVDPDSGYTYKGGDPNKRESWTK